MSPPNSGPVLKPGMSSGKYDHCRTEFLRGIQDGTWTSLSAYIRWAVQQNRGIAGPYLRELAKKGEWNSEAALVKQVKLHGTQAMAATKKNKGLTDALEVLDQNAGLLARRINTIAKRKGPKAPDTQDLDRLTRANHLAMVDVTARLKPQEGDDGLSGELHIHHHYHRGPYAPADGQAVVDGTPRPVVVEPEPEAPGEPGAGERGTTGEEDHSRDVHRREHGGRESLPWGGLVRGTDVPSSQDDHVDAPERVARSATDQAQARQTERDGLGDPADPQAGHPPRGDGLGG
jgi:hypothetical protein